MLHLPVSLPHARVFFNVAGDFGFCLFLENLGASPVDSVLQFCFCFVSSSKFTDVTITDRCAELTAVSNYRSIFFRLLNYGSRGPYFEQAVEVFLRPFVWMTLSYYFDLDCKFSSVECRRWIFA